MIGTKGRDIVLWIFLLFSVIGAFSAMLYPLIICLFCILLIAKFYFYDQKRTIKYRQVVLLPINPFLARLIIKGKLKGEWEKAYEIHIMFNEKPLREQRNNIVADIEEISKEPALYLFETHVGMPMPVKKLIEENGGFLEKGVFLPRPPLAYRKRKSKKLSYGAAIIKED